MTWKDEIRKNETDLPPEVQNAIKEAVKAVASSFKGLRDDRIYSLLGSSRSTKGLKNYASAAELVNDYVDKLREHLIDANKKTWDGTKK